MRASEPAALALRSFLLGVASGGRSMTGLAAVAVTTEPGQLPAFAAALARPRARALIVAGALAEIAADKLPRAPSRLTPPSLTARMGAAATAAAVLAMRERAMPVWYVLPAVAGAVAGSIAGARWRAIADQHGWPPLAAALLEDAVVLGLATSAR